MEAHGANAIMTTSNAAISACEKGQQPERLLSQLSQMEARGREAFVTSSNAAISACEKGRQPERPLSQLSQTEKRLHMHDCTQRRMGFSMA